MGSLTKRPRGRNHHRRSTGEFYNAGTNDDDRLRAGLRCATYSSLYDQYCDGDAGNREGSTDCDTNSSAVGATTSGGSPTNTPCVAAITNTTRHRKRLARMLRITDNSRLQLNNSSSGGRRRHRQQKLRSSSRQRMKNQINYLSFSQSPGSMSRIEYERRKAAWAAKYTSVSTLRKSFGTNKNRIWGDFDPSTTRKLYHTLLPRALLELRGLRDGLMNCDVDNKESGSNNSDRRKRNRHWHQRLWQRKESLVPRNHAIDNDDEIDMDDIDSVTYLQQELKELAPLAFRARLAAKEYARERSRLPARIGSMLYDGYRSWKKYGKWKSTGMTWEQIWNKYEDQVLSEAMTELRIKMPEKTIEYSAAPSVERLNATEDLDDEELTARICLRILERSVVTNDAIDRLFLKRLAVEDNIKHQVGNGGSKNLMGRSLEEGVFDESGKRRHRTRKRKLLLQERQRRRKLTIQADLQAIEKMFDDDIRELLRYSYLTTEQGENRRSKRRGGAFFWKRSNNSGGDNCDHNNTVSGSTSENIEGSKSTLMFNSTSIVDRHDDPRKIAIGGIVDTTNRGGDATDANTGPAAEADTECINLYSANIFSMTKESSESSLVGNGDTIGNIAEELSSERKLSVHEVLTLRILATTKERITLLQKHPDLGNPSQEERISGCND
jgi:hypothetical protein